ncbi:hypothetical protein Dda_3182 [Drechslerella dactyloides]|uniref:SWIM-type domain-containing protein n=1 Tax=Drechslerella dactyloides TaxID=74499 RepID=A0AAD6NL12_DREDA|nr:hypothetical protein Dda_3182 [Drechslerella dactyloides]
MASPPSRRPRQGSPIKYLEGRAARYNSENLTREQWRWARTGIAESDYYVNCEEGDHLTFNLVPHDTRVELSKVKVSIGSEGSRFEYPTCTCIDFRETNQACHHIFWLLDNVLTYHDLGLRTEDGSIPLRRDGHCFRSYTEPYRHIKSVGLARIADSKGWSFSGPNQWSINAQAQDIIRHFDHPLTTSSSLYSDEYLSSSPALSGAIYRLAIAKPQFLADLRQEASVDNCTKSYLKDLERRADNAFKRWINYTKRGHPRLDYRDDDTHSSGGRAPNVVWIAGELREIVYQIEVALYQRVPVSADNQRRAFKLLMQMFEEVMNMDVNTTDYRYRPGGIPVYEESEMEGNLYTRLIRHYSRGNKNFAISAMRRIAGAGINSLEKLEGYRQTIYETASREYAEEFDALCREIQEAAGYRR